MYQPPSPHRLALALALTLVLLCRGVPSRPAALAGEAYPPTPAGPPALRCIPLEQALTPAGPPTTQDPRHITRAGTDEPPLRYSAAVSGGVIEAGKAVDFTLTMKNTGGVPVTFTFPTAQRYDVVIWNDDCVEVWHWSRGRMFAQVITSLGVPAGDGTVFRILWDRRDQAGHPVRVGAYEARVVFLGTWPKRSAPLALPPLVFALR